MSGRFLDGRRIGISVSDSPNAALLGLGPEHVEDMMVEVARHLLGAGATLVYGGDLRPTGFTELLLEIVARHLRRGDASIRFENYLAFPVHASMTTPALIELTDAFDAWGRLVCLGMDGTVLTQAARALAIREAGGALDWERGLTALRRRLADTCDARIVIGGRTSGYEGIMPGVAEEAIMSIEAGKPTFVAGGLGGCALDMARAAGLATLPQLSAEPDDWPGLSWFEGRAASINPGLGEEAGRLANSTHVTEVVVLLLRGLRAAIPEAAG